MTAQERAMQLLISQYQESPNLREYIGALVAGWEELFTVHQVTRDLRNIEGSGGDALDMIAELVGARRVLGGAAAAGFWGYYENSQALGSADEKTPALGGKFYGGNGQAVSRDLRLTDLQLRLFIRARLLVNNDIPNINNLIKFVKYICLEQGEAKVEIQEGKRSMNVRIHTTLALPNRGMVASTIHLFKPAGIKLTLSDDSGNIAVVPLW